MARTVDEIYNSIIEAKNNTQALTSLNSTSKVAIWRLWAYLTALAHHVVETLFDNLVTEVNDIISKKSFGTPSWFAEKSKEFQAGDTLTVVNGIVTYSVIDTAKQIITRVAYKESGGTLTLKVAKGNTNAEPLSNEEKRQFEGYVERIKPAGVATVIISLNADKLRVTAEVFYNALYTQAVIKEAVETALQTYMSGLDFDGLVYKNKVIDAIQKVEGVIDVDMTQLLALAGATETIISRVYETASGYLIQDNTSGFTFSNTITYTPVNV